MDISQIKDNLSMAGCGKELTESILRMYEAGKVGDALLKMKQGRCSLMDEYHRIGQKVDRIDALIRSTEKELEKTDNDRRTKI